jgi:hypothetical protein
MENRIFCLDQRLSIVMEYEEPTGEDWSSKTEQKLHLLQLFEKHAVLACYMELLHRSGSNQCVYCYISVVWM